MSFIWAAHIVHHQSEEYNLTVALRQSWIQSFFTMFFYLPLATLGFPTEVGLGAIAANAVGQFRFHTRTIGRLGFLESFLNTPSHPGATPAKAHRRHSALNRVFVKKFAEKTVKRIEQIEKRTLELCQAYSWPGNIRELQNIVERSMIFVYG